MVDQINSARVIKFGGEIIVELVGTDRSGVVGVITYQFASEGRGRALTSKEPVADEHVSIVQETLEKDELRWVRNPE